MSCLSSINSPAPLTKLTETCGASRSAAPLSAIFSTIKLK